ncbi:step II splicing factor, putative [Plasmodium malariae]|uniref:Pre-mRNA-splicing factor SLU7 n=1 Tax=Plasmodium malariae TaxID=5858 RepID=A0A1C3L0G8_PLAMA|nr:step II splicing factor, putative [Plasmodium malariae]SBT79942.1 step II splicing factor, putative [Plasmodium malariae]SCO93579.1 step II splicing factor, putative [Plasmodium malariae]
MWINKIGNKSASFINHKHFHPGNIKNLERVWLAEESERKRKEEEEKYLKKREEQYKLYVLKKQLTKNEEDNKNALHNNILYDINKERKKENTNKKINITFSENEQNGIDAINNKLIIKSKYNEDLFVKNHKSIYGSYYDIEKKKWGYKCCKKVNKNSICTSNDCDNTKINNTNGVCVKKNLSKSKKKKKKKKKNIVDNSISALLNKIL